MKNTLTLRAAAAAVAILALAGCGTTTSDDGKAPQGKIATAAVADNLYADVHARWSGDDAPSKRWIDTAAMLVCKQISGGIEPIVVPDHAANNSVIVTAAERYVCATDRGPSSKG